MCEVEDFLEQKNRSNGIEEGIVPLSIWTMLLYAGSKFEGVAESAERVIVPLRPRCARQQESIDPWAEAMSRESAEEFFFRALAMSDDDFVLQHGFESGP